MAGVADGSTSGREEVTDDSGSIQTVNGNHPDPREANPKSNARINIG
jgi:hypothetical protein